MIGHISLAADLAFGSFKGAAIVNGDAQPRTAVFPAVVGYSNADIGFLKDPLVAGTKAEQSTFAGTSFITFPDGVQMIVGDRVSEFTRPLTRMDLGRLADPSIVQPLLFATIARLLSPKEAARAPLPIILGLPNEAFSRLHYKNLTERIASWLPGHHNFTVDDVEYEIEIAGIMPLAQPLGAYFEWGTDINGHWSAPATLLTQQVAVLDLGFNTLDLIGIASGAVLPRYTKGAPLGMRRAAEHLITQFEGSYGIEMALHEADALIRQLGDTRRRHIPIIVEGRSIDVYPHVVAAMQMIKNDVLGYVERHWGKHQFGKVLLTGGGSILLQNDLLQLIPHATILDDPVTANARGLSKVGARSDIFSQLTT